MRKWKRKMKEKKNLLKEKIEINSAHYAIPSLNNKQNLDLHSWFDATEFVQPAPLFDKNINFEADTIDEEDDTEFANYYTRKYEINPTADQRKILLKWLDCYTLMYNIINKYIKECMFLKQKVIKNLTVLKKKFIEEKNKKYVYNIMAFAIALNSSNVIGTGNNTYKYNFVNGFTVPEDSTISI